MAGMKFEKGFFAIPNDLFDAIAQAGFTVAERAVIDCIVRYTYGFNRKECQAALSFIVKYTNLKKRTIQKAIGSLIEKKVLIITQEETANTARVYQINGCISQWSGVYHRSPQEVYRDSPHEMNDHSPQEVYRDSSPRCTAIHPRNNNIEITDRNNRGRGQSPAPALEEVIDYCQGNGYIVDPERFWKHYEGNDWMLPGGRRVANWKAILDRWEEEDRAKHPEEQEIETDCYGRPIPPKYEG